MLKAVPALGARDLGLTLTLDAMWPEGLGGLEAWRRLLSGLPRLTTAAKKGRRNQTTGRSNPVWEESEFGVRRKISAGI